MRATYYRDGRPFATYVLDGDGPNAAALRQMVWTTAEAGWEWVVE